MPRSDDLYFGHRRLRFWAGFAVLAPAQLAISWICFALDHLFFPGFRKIEAKAPLFILGNFRSGSTFLYRRLARDTSAFAAMTTREIYLTPSISQRKLWSLARRIDGFFGAPIRRYIHSFDDRVLEAVPYHKVGLSQPEEDEGLLFYRWASFFIWFFFPAASRPLRLVTFDSSLGPRRRRSLMRFYRRCVQRHLYYHGPEKHFLSKNPAFTGKLRSLRETFGDARIACLIRQPVDLVPSMINWFSFAWSYFGDAKRRFLFPELIRDIALYWYGYPLEIYREPVSAGPEAGGAEAAGAKAGTSPDFSPGGVATGSGPEPKRGLATATDPARQRATLRFVAFEEIAGSFPRVAQGIYDFVGHSGDPHARGVVPRPEEVTERPRGLTPELVGLSTDDIRQRFHPVMQEYYALPPEAWIGEGPGSELEHGT